MKVLHYVLGLPPVRGGGLIRYALDIVKGEIENGCEAELLVPGKMQWNKEDTCIIQKRTFQSIPCYYIKNSLPVIVGAGIEELNRLYEYGDERIYEEFLKECNPDIIHIHSFTGLHLAFLQAARRLDIPMVYTTHDYYGLCPKTSLIRQGKICDRANWDTCGACRDRVISKRKIAIKQSRCYSILESNGVYQRLKTNTGLLMLKAQLQAILKKKTESKKNNKVDVIPETDIYKDKEKEQYESLRRYYQAMFQCISAFHFNSAQSKEVFESYLGNLDGRVIPISNRMIKDCRSIKTSSGVVKIGFLGHGAELKGFHILQSALEEMYHEGVDNFECHIYFNYTGKRMPYMRLHKPYSEEQMSEVYGELDVVVVPSICKETFSLVTLEALSYGVPVILSKYVGAKDYLQEQPGMGIIVNPEKEELKNVIKELCRKPKKISDMNKQICAWRHSFSYEEHVQEMIEFYQENLGIERIV